MTAPSSTACGPRATRPGTACTRWAGTVTPRRIAALPADARPNGLAIDPAGRTLYIADSFNGIIWSAPVSGGSVTPWLTDAALAPVPGAALPIGANGLRFHNGAPVGQQLQQGNTAAGTGHRRGRSHPPCRERPAQHRRSQLPDPLLRCGVRGAERLLLGERPGQDRGGLPGRHLQGGSDQRYGLASPSATAVRGNRLYITDGGVPEPHDAKLQTGRINVAALLAGAAH